MNKGKIEEISGSIHYIEHQIRDLESGVKDIITGTTNIMEHLIKDLKSEINIIKDRINNELIDKDN